MCGATSAAVPTIEDAEAAEVAQVAFDNASDLAPEDAAAVYVEILTAHVHLHTAKREVGDNARDMSAASDNFQRQIGKSSRHVKDMFVSTRCL